jgi:CHAT domain-containing protein
VVTILATAYRERILGDPVHNTEYAIDAYQQALTVMTQESMPIQHRRILHDLGFLALTEQHWRLAAEALQGALAASEQLYATASTPEARQAELREVNDLPTACSYALARLSTSDATALNNAAIILERNRARWLTESLALNREKPAAVPHELWQRFMEVTLQLKQLQIEAQLPDNTLGKRDFLTLSTMLASVRTDLVQVIEEVRTFAPEFMPTPSFGNIEAAFATTEDTQAEVGVYLLTTSQGGLALIIHAGSVTPVWLDALTADVSQNLLRGWLEAYNAFLRRQIDDANKQWFSQLDTVTGYLWEIIMEPLAAALHELDVVPQENKKPPVVSLIPTGLLALLPLHAAWTEDATAHNGRHYFLDDYAVRYAPSATVLLHCRDRANAIIVEQFLAIDEPKPIRGGGSLPNSAREVKAIASLFPTATVLQHEQASRKVTLDSLAAAQIVHFSCHGANNWQNPLDSCLLLAKDELLTVRDFLELDLPKVRFATFSVGESGMVNNALPNEVLMLSTALIQAGYAGVVASLWSVADVSTAMLMVRFYHYWQEEGLEPVYALRAAQRWVRDTTNQEKADYFGQFVLGSKTSMPDTAAAEFFSEAMLSKGGLEARSFAHPFWWGAFYLTGV